MSLLKQLDNALYDIYGDVMQLEEDTAAGNIVPLGYVVNKKQLEVGLYQIRRKLQRIGDPDWRWGEKDNSIVPRKEPTKPNSTKGA